MKNKTYKTLLKNTLILLLCLLFAGCSMGKTYETVNEIEGDSSMLIDNISDYDFTDKAMEYLTYIGTNLTNRDCRNSDSDHEATIEWIKSELINAGYDESQIIVHSDMIAGNNVQNVELIITGSDSSKQVIIGGHYDGDGVGDNGSGLALMLANAVGMSGLTPKYDVRFVFFDAEEIGLYGSNVYANNMTSEEVEKTIYMVNIDSIAFGDYCNIYGGTTNHETGEVTDTSAYDLACQKADYLGFNVWGPEDLDGYFEEHGIGPDIETLTIYTSPWTIDNPAPSKIIPGNLVAYSPSTIPYSDHVDFVDRGISYVYFEATNWFAGKKLSPEAYTGYIETYDLSLGDDGMFMNTKYDTLDNLNELFPGRAENHFRIYSPLLFSLAMNPDSEEVV